MMNRDPFEPRLRRYLEERADDRPPVGFEAQVLRQVTTERNRPVSGPRQLFAATAITVMAVGLAAGVAYMRNHGTVGQSPTPSAEAPALSIGTGGGGDWVVQRGVDLGTATRLPGPTHNVLYHTTDGGGSWQARLNFTGIYDGMSWTPDRQVGVVWTFEMTRPCGPTAQSCTLPSDEVVTVFSTTDSGLHWTEHPTQTFGMGASIYFNGKDGWALSLHDYAQGQTATVPQLFHTTDGGASWSKVSDLPGLSRMQMSGGTWGHTSGVGETNFEFANDQHGWLATGGIAQPGNSGLLETTDGGHTWKPVIITAPSTMSAESMVVGYPVMLGHGQALLPVFFGSMTDPNSFSADHHYVFDSSDGGKTWTNPRPLDANGVQPTGDQWQNFYLDANHWWFTAINQRSAGEPVAQSGPAIGRTSDGGKTWQLFRAKDAPTILQMTFTDADHGWAFAVTGPNNTNILLRTTDGGASWHRVQVP
jgi:photosystem II stability/assembly factor-like uncharacterized protein